MVCVQSNQLLFLLSLSLVSLMHVISECTWTIVCENNQVEPEKKRKVRERESRPFRDELGIQFYLIHLQP